MSEKSLPERSLTIGFKGYFNAFAYFFNFAKNTNCVLFVNQIYGHLVVSFFRCTVNKLSETQLESIPKTLECTLSSLVQHCIMYAPET